ncbi:hypothetical protein QOZ80_1AG0003250 [Eleusine coracana subsp. coracana]|nr:hypothetical protein QOZ80_1AG0003250 [Eleusine coracana subsp. coracana]
MAVELASAAMTPLIEKLGNLLVSELTLEKRVRQDVASLHKEMKAMHVALQRVEVPPEQLDQGTAEWASNVREHSNDMEDAVDAFTLHLGENDDHAAAGLRSRFRGFLDKTVRLFSKGKSLHQVAAAVREAKRLTTELDEIHQRYAGLKPKDASVGASSIDDLDPRLKAMSTEAADLVGVDGARDEVIKILSNESKVDVQTVSIVGFGGLGKTTLARAVFDKIKLQFNCSAFVSVSKNPDITKIFKKILYQLDGEKFIDINEAVRDYEQLVHDLKEFLHDKRYLIVIDDLWDVKNWEFIKCAFPRNTCSSRLITTSRKRNVSEATFSFDAGKIHEMKPLSDTDSLRLFHSRIFHPVDGCPPELEQISRDILKKCGGVPLAIISIASLLANRKQVKTKDQWLILLNSIGRGLKGCWSVVDMHKILSLSYYDLPSYLKPCLLYLSIFPESYDIERDRLIWRWMAEGLIQHDDSGYNNLFEIGEGYFTELVNRSMIQPVAIDLEGRAQAYRVHDIMLDLIRSLSTKENFVTVWNDGQTPTSSSSQHSIMARRLSIIQNSTNNIRHHESTTTDMSKVRSFTIFSTAMESMPSLTQFQVVRVLDLEGCDLSSRNLNLRHVGKLGHLRYLGLRRTCIRELPDEVGKLQFLQTLDVRGRYGVQELPATITGLQKLMCLRLDWDTRLPNGLGNLTSLEELTGLRIGGEDSAAIVTELGHLTGLRVLTLRWERLNINEALVQSLGNLRKLQSLDMYVTTGGRGDLMRDWAPPPRLRRFLCRGPTCALPKLPAWMKKNTLSSSLAFLDILVGQVGPDDLQALGALPSLRGVRLRSMGRVDDYRHPPTLTEVNADAFWCARACAFLNFVTVPSMFRRGAMPRVQRLEFTVRAWDFAAREGFGLDDLCMGHLTSLEEVHIELWSTKDDDAAVVAAALRQAAEDHPNRLAIHIKQRSAGGRPRFYHQHRRTHSYARTPRDERKWR